MCERRLRKRERERESEAELQFANLSLSFPRLPVSRDLTPGDRISAATFPFPPSLPATAAPAAQSSLPLLCSALPLCDTHSILLIHWFALSIDCEDRLLTGRREKQDLEGEQEKDGGMQAPSCSRPEQTTMKTTREKTKRGRMRLWRRDEGKARDKAADEVSREKGRECSSSRRRRMSMQTISQSRGKERRDKERLVKRRETEPRLQKKLPHDVLPGEATATEREEEITFTSPTSHSPS